MGVREVLLTSKSHLDNMFVSLNRLRLQGLLCDMTVKVDYQGEAQEFQAHQLMLAASSGYFKTIVFSEHWFQDKLLLTNMHSSDFSKFLDFVYTGNVRVNKEKIADFQVMAEFLDCKDLLEVCQETMSAGVFQKQKRKAADEADGEQGQKEQGQKEQPRRSKRKKNNHRKRLDSQDSDFCPNKQKMADKVQGKMVKGIKSKLRAGRTIVESGQKSTESVQDTEEKELNETEETDAPKDTLTSDDEKWQLKGNDLVDDEDSFLLFGDGEEEEDENLEEETFQRSSKAQFECNKCQRTFHYEKSYLKHISTYHGVKAEVIYRCDTCQQTFANRSNLKTHEKHVHSTERQFFCDTCTKTFKRKKDVVRHQRQVHERDNQKHICGVCGKSLSCKASLMLHERIHTGTKPFECSVCGARFTQKTALNMHSRRHTGEKPFACDKCDSRFTQKHMLAYHIRSHTGEKPFMCEACGKSFSSREYLRHHSNIHTGIKPFKCKHCDRGFSQRNSLNQHLKIHTGDRPYSCKFCEKHFTQLNALQRHQRIHTGEKPFMCSLCNRTFTDKSTLRRHTSTHAADAPWKSYLVVLEGNVEEKKSPEKTQTKTKSPKTPTGEKKSKKNSNAGAKEDASQTQSGVTEGSVNGTVTETVTVPSDWASHGAIAVVSHTALGGIAVIHTEIPSGTHLQPIVTTDGTGASVLALDTSTITVPFSLAASVAQSIPLSSQVSSTSMSIPTVSVSNGTIAIVTESQGVCTSSVLEATASQGIVVSESDAKSLEGDVLEINVETEIVPEASCEIEEMTMEQSDVKNESAEQNET